ncbi:MAG: hypothetical protein SFV51_06860 [Bryobacteraceae bacterium]|nr:hypothetical protein [Bryobacteraceae bacterium]
MRTFAFSLATLLLGSALAVAGEKGMMHCFAFTPIKEATQADWDAFYKATDAMPGKISEVKKVWYGKLRAPLAQYNTTDAAARKRAAAGEKGVQAELTVTRREYGVCMLMGGPGDLKTYTTNPYHKVWMAAYEKVRVAGTTTYDIIAE